MGLSLPGILGGALIVESLFNYPGMGLLFWNAAQTEDFPVMLGTSLVVGLGVVLDPCWPTFSTELPTLGFGTSDRQ